MTVTETDIDWETIMGKSIPCVYPECELSVAWIMAHPCCGHEYFVCDKHKIRNQKIAESVVARGHEAICYNCGARFDPTEIHYILI